MRIRALPILVLPLLLAACSTPQQRAERLQAEMADLMAIYGPACTRLGYAPNSDPWRECVLQLSTRDEVRRYGPSYHGGYGPRGWRGGGFWGPYW
ncbi:hypothetical protein [Massilia sp. BKSP1R2A-1]|jgi:hypothetical protein|uniref:hypothetical protein n=1 Tax=Massilia sp. BKSP1R2A-1 TaxID=3422595 RepID=UPI003D3479C4